MYNNSHDDQANTSFNDDNNLSNSAGSNNEMSGGLVFGISAESKKLTTGTYPPEDYKLMRTSWPFVTTLFKGCAWVDTAPAVPDRQSGGCVERTEAVQSLH
jgi:hypothetical protein